MDKAFSIGECMELLNIGECKIKRLLKEGTLEPVYVRTGIRARTRMISVSSIARYVNNDQIRRNRK